MSYLTVEEVAAEIRMHPEYVTRLCAAGTLPAKKLGNRWRVHPDDLAAFMRGEAKAPAAQPRPPRLTARQARQLQRHGP
jgi:excisionase family DNA binding protein